MTKLKSFLKFTLLWSWLVSLPILLLGGYWAVATSQRFDTFAIRYGTGFGASAVYPSAIKFAEYEYGSIKRRMKVFLLSGIRNESELPVINLKVPESELKKLNRHLPQSGFEYVKGTIETDAVSYTHLTLPTILLV